MKSLSTRDIMRAIGTSLKGCRELDVFMFILLHPEKRYFYEDGQYYTFASKNPNIRRNILIKSSRKYTTSIESALHLLKKNWIYDIRITNLGCSISINTRKGLYVHKSPDVPLGICYTIANIIDTEGYVTEESEEKGVKQKPIKETLFFTHLDIIRKDRKKLEEFEKKNARRRERKLTTYFS